MSDRNGRSIAGASRLPGLAGGLLALAMLAAPMASRAEEVTVSGCPAPGVEAGCIMLTANGKTYNVTAATPKPQIGVAGQVTGTVSDGASMCAEGIVLSPAVWRPTPSAACPPRKPQ